MLLGWVVFSAQLYCLCSEPNLSIHTSLSSHQLAWLCWRKHSYYMMMPPLIGWCVQWITSHIYTKSIHLWNWLKTYPSQYGFKTMVVMSLNVEQHKTHAYLLKSCLFSQPFWSLERAFAPCLGDFWIKLIRFLHLPTFILILFYNTSRINCNAYFLSCCFLLAWMLQHSNRFHSEIKWIDYRINSWN